ncbi:MAG: hypothetical protein OQK12_14830 [Motiliproteus sp.]|nr:hypothetical protein [Motiliproteus sp.]
MSTIKVLGIDLGKSSFHIVGRDQTGHTILRKKFSRPNSLNNSPIWNPVLSPLKPAVARTGWHVNVRRSGIKLG